MNRNYISKIARFLFTRGGMIETDNNYPFTIQKKFNFVIECSFRAYFKDNLMLIKDWIGTIPLKLLVSFLWEGGIINMEKSRGFIDFILPPSCKLKTKNFRAIVPIQFLIYIKFSLKWALDEVSTSKLMNPIIWEIAIPSTSFTTHNWVLLQNLMWWT